MKTYSFIMYIILQILIASNSLRNLRKFCWKSFWAYFENSWRTTFLNGLSEVFKRRHIKSKEFTLLSYSKSSGHKGTKVWKKISAKVEHTWTVITNFLENLPLTESISALYHSALPQHKRIGSTAVWEVLRLVVRKFRIMEFATKITRSRPTVFLFIEYN